MDSLSNNLNNFNLLQLLDIAKNVHYNDPELPQDEWNQDEIMYKAIAIALDNPIQIRAALIMIDMFSPLKLVFKSIIRRYIKQYQP